MQQAGYHHANMLAEQLRTDLQVQGTEMLAIVQEMAAATINPPENGNQPPPAPAANAALQPTAETEMLQLLRTIAANCNLNGSNDGQGARNYSRGQNGRGVNGGRGNAARVIRRTPDNANFAWRITNLYCHTHGACNHTSIACTNQAPGHENEATMTNRMGGSNAFCGE